MGFRNSHRIGAALALLLGSGAAITPPPASQAPSTPSVSASQPASQAKPSTPAPAQAGVQVEKLRHSGGFYPRAERPTYRRPGWSVAEGKRRARKARNVATHKARARG